MNLEPKYKTSDAEEEASCLFLDPNRGCILPEEKKPFECRLWPLRVMKKDGKNVVAVALTCPAIKKSKLPAVKKLLAGGLLDVIRKEVANKPYLPAEYNDSYLVLASLEKETKTKRNRAK